MLVIFGPDGQEKHLLGKSALDLGEHVTNQDKLSHHEVFIDLKPFVPVYFIESKGPGGFLLA